MTPQTQPYRNQHRELERLAAAIPVDHTKLNARTARTAIDGLRSVLAVHLKLQNGLLHPWIKTHGSPEIQRLAVESSQAGERLMHVLETFGAQWSTSESIAAQPRAFVESWRVVFKQLCTLMADRERALYAAIDGHAAREQRLAAS